MVRKISKAAVIGSGIMGGGIAALLAGAGVKVLLLDIVPFDLSDEEKNDPAARNRIVKAGMDGALAAQPPLFYNKKDAGLIEIGNLTDDFDKLADCDWICEVVVENLKIKQELFKRIEGIRKPSCIVSSNTSGIPLKAMSEGLSPEFKTHFLGTHFFNPVRWMHLLELIPGEETAPEVLRFMERFGEINLGKGIVWAKDTPNFIGNRIGIQGMGKIMQEVVKQGLTLAEVDALFGPAMGRPSSAIFGTADLVGLDTMAHVMENSYDLCPDDEERETHVLPEFVTTMVEKGWLGNKTRGGFFKKEKNADGKKVKLMLDPATCEYVEFVKADFPCLTAAKAASTPAEKIKAVVYGDDKGAKFAWDCSANGLIYAANRIPEIAASVVEIDNAMKWGYAVETGPFETWDLVGVKESVARMEADGLSVPEKVKAMLAAGNDSFYKVENGRQYFYDFATESYQPVKLSETALSLATCKADGKVVKSCPSVSLVDIGDDVFCVEFTTKMNALNREIIEFMGEIKEFALENAAGIVIGNQAGGMPGAFSAGADLDYVLGLCKGRKFAEMDEFLSLAQNGIKEIRYANVPVVAAPYGMTLGGGCEVCIGAADKIVGAADLMMGLVEMGVGLLPAGGGCTNLWKKFVFALPDPVQKDTDLSKLFVPVFMAIGMAKYSMSAKQSFSLGHMHPWADRIVMNRDLLIGEAKKEVLAMVDAGYAPPVKKPVPVMGEAGTGMIHAQIYNMLKGGFLSEHDALIATRIATVISGGSVKEGTAIDEDVMYKLEREAFIDFAQEEKTIARIEHMLKKGAPLRN
ncbi:3-hydroxyacyl-CoA dehydrogenase/enoyl-CoA hydratase family protein [Desulfoluna butyratoxydans]|uniref:Enoyl-coa hydratase/isomerase n=1 Tax=Desulfoluna butyratoxydans TaxID=231438 RepID=A0A4U8YLW1_9BACT|nr:3-hydroxyacyl-CoA dehydrogenase/enoyl-CoA hydratase family protein [Desulfoluna butyratoxydans]VFQ44985.1 enoyl-coa hydratase/isomerase [Desulfoluna butyratoxydans]